MNNTIWTVRMASDWHFTAYYMVKDPIGFAILMEGLTAQYGCPRFVINMEKHEIIIYDDYLE